MKSYYQTVIILIIGVTFFGAEQVTMAQDDPINKLEYDRSIHRLRLEKNIIHDRLINIKSENQRLFRLCFDQAGGLAVLDGYCQELRRIIHHERAMKFRQTQQISEFYQGRERNARLKAMSAYPQPPEQTYLWADMNKEIDLLTINLMEVLDQHELHLSELDQYERAFYALQVQLLRQGLKNASLSDQILLSGDTYQQDNDSLWDSLVDQVERNKYKKKIISHQKVKIDQLKATVTEYRRLVDWQSELIRKQDQHILTLEGRMSGLSAWLYGH